MTSSSLNLVATIDGAEIDRAEGVSYEVGSANCSRASTRPSTRSPPVRTPPARPSWAADNAVRRLRSPVTVVAVKERELPEADDDFAQMASEFDTIGELRESLVARVGEQAVFTQAPRRDKLVDALIAATDIPVPAQLVEDEVHQHLEGVAWRLEDDVHRAEVTGAPSEKKFRTQMILDKGRGARGAGVSQGRATQYHPVGGAVRYGPGQEFVDALRRATSCR
ncbi:MAG: hypothetical protein R2692_07375 [Microbacterium sp.]